MFKFIHFQILSKIILNGSFIHINEAIVINIPIIVTIFQILFGQSLLTFGKCENCSFPTTIILQTSYIFGIPNNICRRHNIKIAQLMLQK